jgi:CheY-like chemotaxis protein/HPt (histidine-containing phosphotransfer) domain-containing protein
VRALAQARDEAVETARIKSEFLTNVSHEIRTPLNAVVGSSEMLLGTRLDAEQREYAENLSRAARTLLELVSSVLDFSKIEAGRMTVERRRLRPGALLADAAALLAPRAAEKGLALKTDDGGTAALEFLGDSTRLRQVLLNLLANAVKFTDRGEVLAAISTLSSDENAAELEFSVRDTGIGIPPEEAERLFLPFIQGDGTMTRRFGGTGLGLAISRSLVELMGGTIGYENVPGGGSRFWFRLRLDRADASGAPEPEAARETAPSSERRDRLRILVVDDNEINRRLLQRQLDRLGCPAVAVGGGRAALEELREADFSLILLDCQMPDLDGYATAAEIRRLEGERRRTPIAAVTANATQEVRKRCADAGMDDFVSKPATLSDLAAAIDRWDRPFDETALKGFAAVAAEGPGGLTALLENFLTDSARRLETARGALKRGDFDACRLEAHSIKGAAKAVGARGLAELSRLLEAAAEASDAPREEEISALLLQADVEVARLRADAAFRAAA